MPTARPPPSTVLSSAAPAPNELKRLRNASLTWSVSLGVVLAVLAAVSSNAPNPSRTISSNDPPSPVTKTTSMSRLLEPQLLHKPHRRDQRQLTDAITSAVQSSSALRQQQKQRQRATASVYDEPSTPMTTGASAGATASTTFHSVYDEPATAAAADGDATKSGSDTAPAPAPVPVPKAFTSVYDEPMSTSTDTAKKDSGAASTTTVTTRTGSVYDEPPPPPPPRAEIAAGSATTSAASTTTTSHNHAKEVDDDDHEFVVATPAKDSTTTTTTITTTTVTTITTASGASSSQSDVHTHSESYDYHTTPSSYNANNYGYGYTPTEKKKNKPVFAQEHPPLWPPTSSTIWGYFLAILSLVIAAGGGIGGGGLLVPIYIIVMGFNPKHAIPLSNVTVFGGAIANMYLNLSKRHPLVDRPLVDWDLILVMEPLTIAGALIGAFLNKVLPELVLTLALVALLGFTAYTTFQKAGSLRRKETAALAAAGFKPDGSKQSELTLLVQNQEGEGDEDEDGDDEKGGPEAAPVDDSKDADADDSTKINPTLREILEYERHTPIVNLQILGALFAVVLAVNLLKGGGAFKSPLGITCGSTMFWLANAFMLLWILAITALVRQYLVKRNNIKLECGYPFVEGDIQWNERATLVYPLVCCLAGFTAGMFGIGGGIVKGPLMLAMGVHPAVSSASSACMILFTSFTATTSYMVFGLLLEDYAVACLVLGFVATFAGQVGINAIMARTGNRYSYIAYSVAIVVLLSACLMTIQSLLSMAEGEKHHSGGVCGAGD